jgi:hypothetical protein
MAAAGAALVGLDGCADDTGVSSGATAAKRSRGRPPVLVSIAPPTRAVLGAGGSLRLRLRHRRGGRVRLSARLRFSNQARVPLSRTRRLVLHKRRWRAVSIPLSQRAMAAAKSCAATRIEVLVADRRYQRTKIASAAVRSGPPDCGRFFGPRAVWNSELRADAPLDPASPGIAAELVRRVRQGLETGPPPWINTVQYSPPIRTVPAAQPRVPVLLDRPPGYDQGLTSAFSKVPIPSDALPAAGADSELVVWQPDTDTMWEFWQLHKERDGWHASWGGRLDHVDEGPGHFTAPHANWGTSASSLPLAGGLILPHELESGQVEHALSLGVPAARAAEFALPAQRTDGSSPCANSIPEGARFRLDPAVDIDSLGLPPPTAALARAAQRYGIIVRDQSAAVVFYAQNPAGLPADPWPAIFGGQTPDKLLAAFPWSRLQLLKMDLAKADGPNAPVPSKATLLPCP